MRLLINRKIEFLKGIICVLLIANWSNIYQHFLSYMQDCYSENNIEYMLRIVTIVGICSLIVYGITILTMFLKKNAESLLLLGMSDSKILRLFFIRHYELFFIMIYIGTMSEKYYGINIFCNVLANGLNACILGLLIVIGCFAVRISYIRKLLYVFIIIVTALFGFGKINYENAYKLVMSEWVRKLFCSGSLYDILLQLPLLLLFFLLARKMLEWRGIVIETNQRRSYKNNLLGDFLHKMGKYSSFRKNYFWIYRDADFTLWKMIATVFFAVFARMDVGVMEMVLCGYVISLITASYFLDIYRFESKQLVIYYMSDYPYSDMLKTQVQSGMAVMGDSIFMVLLIYSFRNIKCIPAMLIMYVLLLVTTLFLQTALYAKYPKRLYLVDYVVILIKMHIPLWNIWAWYKDYTKGKKRWSELGYGK